MTETTARRDEILAAAAVLFARKGIKSTTVREIGDAVGVLSGSLYYHFDSKEAMAREILMDFLTAIQKRYATVLTGATDAADGLRRLVHASLQLAREKPHATALYQNELHYLRENPRFSDVQEAAADVQRTWLDLIERGVAEGSLRADIPPRVFHRLVRDAVWLSSRSLRTDREYPAERLARDITSIVLHGFAAASSQAGQVAH
ncbi:MAG TPA: TetR/AcrR family transcriptional regulator [Trebonia sp.]|nr:TetR/AcrR family transcriptional regulator [Trebonia sp.]